MIALSHLDLGKDVFADLVLKGVIAKLENDYGIRLTAVECKGIRLEGEYQDNATEQWRAQQDANRDMTKRTGSTTGALMAMLASMTKAKGQTLDQRLEEVQAEFRASPEGALKKYEGLIKLNSPFIEQQIASDSTSPSLRRFYFQGGSGGLDIMAMLGEALRGNGGNPAPQPAPAPRQGNRQPATPPASPPVATAPTKTDAQLAQDFANDNGGQYPAWDPLKRKPVYKE
jgi:hypothetical protein